ncbi:hypothetical protein [Heyndrickxia faecalis]|uniref:hypothetical protein n=1 Tax=Heyndrickxia faecalis TaxID=2824910 RepID=UPI003D1A32EB
MKILLSLVVFIMAIIVSSFIFRWGFERLFGINLDLFGLFAILLSIIMVKTTFFDGNE